MMSILPYSAAMRLEVMHNTRVCDTAALCVVSTTLANATGFVHRAHQEQQQQLVAQSVSLFSPSSSKTPAHVTFPASYHATLPIPTDLEPTTGHRVGMQQRACVTSRRYARGLMHRTQNQQLVVEQTEVCGNSTRQSHFASKLMHNTTVSDTAAASVTLPHHTGQHNCAHSSSCCIVSLFSPLVQPSSAAKKS